MDKDFFFYEDHIREAQRLRNQALGQIVADGFRAAKRLVTRIAHLVVVYVTTPRDPLPH